MDYKTTTKKTCAHCGRTFKVGPLGRVPLFCRLACRITHFDQNKRGTRLSSRDRQRILTWELLQDAELVPAGKPLPPRRKQEHE